MLGKKLLHFSWEELPNGTFVFAVQTDNSVAVRPVTATRRAMKRSPDFHPEVSASVRSCPSSGSSASSSGASPSPM